MEQVNCDKKIIKNAMFSLSELQTSCNLEANIVAVSVECEGNEIVIGHHKIDDFHCIVQRMVEKYEKQSKERKTCGNVCSNQPSYEIIRELVQLVNDKDLPSGSLHFTLRLTCFGPTFVPKGEETCKKNEAKKVDDEKECLDFPNPKDSEFNEYSAEINGNQLIIRVHKDDPSLLVTRVFDEPDKNLVSIHGCGQKIDFKFPENFSCGDSKKKSCDCGPDSKLTEFQKKTSCKGNSFKNSCKLPAIRGNLKYPGRLDGGYIKFDVNNPSPSSDSTEKYVRKPTNSRGACVQVSPDNLQRELEGTCKVPEGVQICKKACPDDDRDVFILKLGSKNTNKKGRKNEIELEMRTPKAPDTAVKKMETREIQVIEKEFPPPAKKRSNGAVSSPKPISKK